MVDANAKLTKRLALAGRLTTIGGVMGLTTACYAAARWASY
jgi:hypothetical protein